MWQHQQCVPGIPAYGGYVCAAPIEENDKGIIILNKHFSDPEVGVNYFMQPYRTSLYFIESTWKDDIHMLSLYRWDTIAQELDTLFEGEVPFSVNEFWVEENRILFSDALSGNIYSYAFEDGKIRLLFDFNSDGGEYDRLCFSDGKIVGWVLDAGHAPILRVADFTGDVLLFKKVDIPEYRECGASQLFCGADEDSLYYYLRIAPGEFDSDGTYGELVAISLDTGAFRRLWSDEEES